MVSLLIQNVLIPSPLIKAFPINSNKKPILLSCQKTKPILCFQSESTNFLTPNNFINKISKPNTENVVVEKRRRKEVVVEVERESNYGGGSGEKIDSREKMMVLCGLGYWVQGFRCFPWLALNFHMAHNLNFDPSTLQLVQYAGNLPMVAKPVYGILSDALYIGGAHRIPYICIGVILQMMSWGPLALIPYMGEVLPTLMACVLLSNLGAAITEVAQDALVAEYGQKHKMVGLQSYAFMVIAVAGILGNSIGGALLSRTHPRIVLFIFTVLLSIQLLISMSTKEEWLGLSNPPSPLVGQEPILISIKKQFSNLLVALSGDRISRPLIWVVTSIAMVPMLTGSIFCCQTQHLNLDPSIIGISKVTGQLLLLSLTVLYNRVWKNIPLRKLITTVQLSYAAALLLDLVLVKQINLKLGIPNDIFALCFSGLAETIATFKTVPFFVLIGSLCPAGSEASVTAFVASALTLSSIASGFFGIGLASVLGVTSGSYANLPLGISIQFFAALIPLIWINNLPLSLPAFEKEKKRGKSMRSRRNRRVGRVVLSTILSYRRERAEV